MSYYPGQKPFTHPDLELKDPNKIKQQQTEIQSNLNPSHPNVTSTSHEGVIFPGTGKNLGFQPNPNCKKCEGTGYKKGKEKICKECSKQSSHPMGQTEICKKCNGTGFKIKDKTKKCKKCSSEKQKI